MRSLAILIAGEPVPAAFAARGSYADMIRAVVGDAWQGPWQDVDARAELPDFERFAGLIVTGSSANVPTREAWILALEQYLARAVRAGLPVFGICFGHQLLGQALGGLVTKNPKGREIGTVPVEVVASDPLLAGIEGPLWTNMTHIDSVVTLPPGAHVLARSALDENAMVRFTERAWGVQFHPEIDREIIGHYVAARREALSAEGLDASAIEAELADTPAAQAILRRFAASSLLKC
ncbi:MAG TPA: glutamine amidotransferase [Polyangiaceae bacterium]|nr:glutamine amidotransferase [Polyangiaceae bacterium]